MNWAAVLAIGGILFLIAIVYQPLEYYGAGTGSSDLNEMDANSLYVQKNPLANQTINGFGLDINNSSLVDATLNVRNNGGASAPLLRSWTGASLGLYIQDVFGFPGIFCPTGRSICFFGVDNLTAYFALTAAAVGKSVFYSDAGYQFQGGGNVEITQGANLNIIDAGNLVADNNVNARDLNVSRNSNLQNLRIANDANFLRNARINDSLYVDKNIYADTYERDRSAEVVFDTCYTNPGKRDMVVYGSVLAEVKTTGDQAYIIAFTGTGCTTRVQNAGIQQYTSAASEIEQDSFPFSFLVHDGNSFQLTTTLAGTGALTLEYVRSYYP